MKNEKGTAAKHVLRAIAVLLLGAALGTLLLAGIYQIPQSAMRRSVESSAAILREETLYPRVMKNVPASQLDNFTDALILNITYYKGGSFAEDMLSSVYTQNGGNDPLESLYGYMTGAEGEYHEEYYGRYWHGYQVVLAPLLTIFDLSQIRWLNTVLQIALAAAVLLTLYVRGRKDLLLPYGIAWMSLMPAALFYSLQFSSTFYIMAILSLVVASRSGKTDFAKMCLAFEIAGILEAYFDFLTYPLVTFGVPAILWFALDIEKKEPLRRRIWQLVRLGVSWGLGYLGMWSSKWVIAALFARDDTLATAFQAIKFRSAMQLTDEVKISYLDVLKANVFFYVFWGFAVLFAAGILLWLVKWLRQRKREPAPELRSALPTLAIIAVCAMTPFVWYLATANHSYLHSWFTFRELSIFLFGGFTIPYVYLYCRRGCRKEQQR